MPDNTDFETWMAEKGHADLCDMMVAEDEHTARRVRLLMESAFVAGGNCALALTKAPETKP